ncbi:TetR/AcrR family transcriptional regulator [Micromonospora chersina]|uniref:TetR/AcrR family transcriptional regulator n=1 Tax=Micromonospora chersina TaxID=47854 RepID=UPI0033ECFB19
MGPTGRVDGRTARAARTRAAIVEAHLGLVGEGDLRPTGDRIAERVDAYCRQRARLLQLIAPSARAAQLREPLSPQLHRNRLKHVDRVRDEVERLFAAELDRAGPGREHLVHALVAASMWSAWSMLRDGLGLDVGAARAVMARAVAALLADPAGPPLFREVADR